MSSLRRVKSSRANGARSKGPSTPAGKERYSLNAMRHGLCAKCVVVEGESRENFLILLQQHVDRFRPAGEVEFGMIEEMCASYWRQRRAWSLETGMFNKQMANQSDGSMMDRMVVAFDTLAASPSLSLLHRYETRLHLMYQRALRTLIVLRTVDRPNDDMPNDPSPISEHSPTQQVADSEPLSGAANPGCSRLSAGPRSPATAASAASHAPAAPSVAPRDAGPKPKEPSPGRTDHRPPWSVNSGSSPPIDSPLMRPNPPLVIL